MTTADSAFYFSRPLSYLAPMAWLLRRLRGLSPLGPIFGKELRTTARLKRTYALRFFYLAVLLVILLFFFLIARSETDRAGSVARRAQKLAELGAIFFGVFSFFTLAAMGLIGPVLTATSINSERLHKTLPVLLMTPITAWQIVAGKLFSRLLIAFTLIGLSLPALSVVRLLGGVETSQIVSCLCLCASVVIFCAAVGLLLSTLMNRAYAVILLSYAFMGLIYALAPMILVLCVQLGPVRGPGRERIIFFFLSLTNPVAQMFSLVVPTFPRMTFGWADCALLHLGAAGLLLFLSAMILRRTAKRADEGATASVSVPGIAPPPFSISATGETPAPRQIRSHREFAPRAVSDNPILWREIRRPLTSRTWQAVALATAAVVILLAIYTLMAADNGLADKDAQIGFAEIFCGILCVLTCVISATAIAQEKESDTWTLLLATPLSAGRIVLAKAAGLMRRLLWPSVLIVAHFFLFTLAGVIDWTSFWVILWLIFASDVLWLASGLYLSLRLRTVTFAVIINLLLPVLVYLGALVMLGILGAIFDNPYHPSASRWPEIVGLYSPYGLIPSSIEYLAHSAGPGYNYNYYAAASHAAAREVWIPYLHGQPARTFIQTVFIVGFGYLLLGGLILFYTAWQFDAIVGRARQARRQASGPTHPQ